MDRATAAALVAALPKAELHLHLEGTLEPEMMFEMAARNGVALPYGTVAEARAAYQFHDLQSFLELYYRGTQVLRSRADFRELTAACVERVAAESVRHAEVFFDPQAHTARGIPLTTVLDGIWDALSAGAEAYAMSFRLIACFLRHRGEEEALACLDSLLPHRDRIAGVGLDSTELGHPPSGFQRVFAAARGAGLRVVAHAGEEGPASYVREALDLLRVERIDHGVRCDEDPALVRELAARGVPLTVCPLSNVRLGGVQDLRAHNLARLLRAGVRVTINSDDPAYFGGYLSRNLVETAVALDLSVEELVEVVANGFRASFLPDAEKAARVAEVLRASSSFLVTAVHTGEYAAV